MNNFFKKVLYFSRFFRYNIHIESERNKIMKDKLFKVTTKDEVTHVKAFDLNHAERVAARLFGNCQVEAVEGRFKRFKEFNR